MEISDFTSGSGFNGKWGYFPTDGKIFQCTAAVEILTPGRGGGVPVSRLPLWRFQRPCGDFTGNRWRLRFYLQCLCRGSQQAHGDFNGSFLTSMVVVIISTQELKPSFAGHAGLRRKQIKTTPTNMVFVVARDICSATPYTNQIDSSSQSVELVQQKLSV